MPLGSRSTPISGAAAESSAIPLVARAETAELTLAASGSENVQQVSREPRDPSRAFLSEKTLLPFAPSKVHDNFVRRFQEEENRRHLAT